MKTLALIALLIGAPFAAAAEEDPTGRAMSGVWSTQKLPSEKFLQMGQELIVDNKTSCQTYAALLLYHIGKKFQQESTLTNIHKKLGDTWYYTFETVDGQYRTNFKCREHPN